MRVLKLIHEQPHLFFVLVGLAYFAGVWETGAITIVILIIALGPLFALSAALIGFTKAKNKIVKYAGSLVSLAASVLLIIIITEGARDVSAEKFCGDGLSTNQSCGAAVPLFIISIALLIIGIVAVFWIRWAESQ